MQCEVSLRDLKNDVNHPNKDFWFYFGVEDPAEPKIEIKLRYHYSKIIFLQQVLSQWQRYIKDDITELDNIENYLELIKSPDGFFKKEIAEKE